MGEQRRQVGLHVEKLEPKQLLSNSAISALAPIPVLTMYRYNSTLRGIEQAVGTLTKTDNFRQFNANLTELSARLPYGQRLLSQWKLDQSVYAANNPGSGLAMQRQLLSDTVAYVQCSVAGGQFRIVGQGANLFAPKNQQTQLDPIARDGPKDSYFEFALAIVRDDVSALSVNVSAKITWYDANMHQQNAYYPTNGATTPFNWTKGNSYLLYVAYNGNTAKYRPPAAAMATFTLNIAKRLVTAPDTGQQQGPLSETGLVKNWADWNNRGLIPNYSLTFVSGNYILTRIYPS